MKILISTDIEGVAGVVHHQQVRAGNPEYERARVLMAQEANAAIAGAFDGGATEVLVNDSHGDFRNMPAELLDPRARFVLGKPRYLGMMAGVDQGVQAVCMIGYHARAQGRGILAHTTNSFAFRRVLFDDVETGEAGMYGALAGEYGVPVVMCSGDDAFIEEHRALFPGAVFVQTKQATGQTSGISLSPAAAREAIRAGVATALRQPGRAAALVLRTPLQVRVQTQSPALADLFCQWPTLQRRAVDEIAFDAPSVEAAVRTINCLSAMSSLLR
ncbi:M55 family metallopeptidase [Ramlibacter sp.]|uniref:M55 family metallopeptidase n=1 Tax=Ramlibacter sp. TaxID=1917967 RepID=UPI002B5A7819|nr:M55 family metallopeptidase [Ramlibacter sp.]HWI82974.1 M55 family metallopeptidase [Ramlibacter sp.]